MRAMALSRVDPGKEVTVIYITWGSGIKQKLHGIEIGPGVGLTVLNRNGASRSVMIAARDPRLAVAYGTRQKIIDR